jgi:hypothetical protein
MSEVYRPGVAAAVRRRISSMLPDGIAAPDVAVRPVARVDVISESRWFYVRMCPRVCRNRVYLLAGAVLLAVQIGRVPLSTTAAWHAFTTRLVRFAG